MHHIYHSDAVVLGGIPIEESSRFLVLLTEEFGCIRAVAKSVREEKSKLRYGLQELSYSRVALVRGRDVWRITGAQEYEQFYRIAAQQKERGRARIQTMLRFRNLLLRLLQGEAADQALFHMTLSALRLFVQGEESELQDSERLFCAQILQVLGYADTTLNHSLRVLTEDERIKIDTLISRALHASQL